MTVTHPSKEQVREWLRSQVEAHKMPPEPSDIRRALGWGMVANDVKTRSENWAQK